MSNSLWIAVTMLLLAGPVAAEDYPSRTVTIVVPFVPGGTTDTLARILAQGLEQRFGKPFVVENKPGAGALTGAVTVAKAAPDGYTLMVSPSSALAANVTLYKALPYDPQKDFVPLVLMVHTPFVLCVNPDLPVKSVADLVALAKQKPLTYASTGIGTPHQLFAELFKSMTGIEMTHVPYRGSAPALNDVVAGHVDVIFVDVAPAIGMIVEGKIRALGVTSGQRVEAIENVPPLKESVEGFDTASWQMAIAPAATPPEIVDILHVEMKKIMARPEVRDMAVKTGMLPIDSPSVPQMQAFIKDEIAKWAAVVQKAGIAGSQ
jgi:tripartite-type tricarboxylate transporter receptor subunit TctC